MNKRIIGQLGTLAGLLLIGSNPATAATTPYALAVSSSKLYVINSTTHVSTPLISFGNSQWSRDVVLYGDDKVVVTEVNNTGSSLRVFQLTRPSGNFVATEITSSKMTLSSVGKAGALAVTSNGGIYVGDDSTGSSTYAYISSLGGTPVQGTIGTAASHSQFVDVAASGNNGLIISQNEDVIPIGLSHITNLQNGDTKSLEVGSDNPRYPRAVAALGGYAYVASKVMTSGTTNGALSIYNTATSNVVSSTALTGFIPTDVTTFSLGSTDYLALIGTSGGTPTALKATLTGGTPGPFTSFTIASGLDYTAGFQCKASLDGGTLWFTQPSSGSVGMFSTATWSGASFIPVGDQLTALATFDAALIPVPEPSSLLALASFGAGALGFFRRRKRA